MKRRRLQRDDEILLAVMAQGYLSDKACFCKNPKNEGRPCIYHEAEKVIQRVKPSFQWTGYTVYEYPAPAQASGEVPS